MQVRHKRHGFKSLGWEDPLEESKATHSSLENPMDGGAGEAASPWGSTQLDMTEVTQHTHRYMYMSG